MAQYIQGEIGGFAGFQADKMQGGALALVDLMTESAGMARMLAEWAGAAIPAGNSPCPIPHPHAGRPGHMHTAGATGGSKLLTTIFQCHVGFGTGSQNRVVRNKVIATVKPRAIIYDESPAIPMIPNCGPGGSTESLLFTCRVNTSAAAHLNVEVSGAVTAGQSGISLSSGSNAVQMSVAVPVIPGRFNRVRVRIELERVSTDCIGELQSWALHTQ